MSGQRSSDVRIKVAWTSGPGALRASVPLQRRRCQAPCRVRFPSVLLFGRPWSLVLRAFRGIRPDGTVKVSWLTLVFMQCGATTVVVEDEGTQSLDWVAPFSFGHESWSAVFLRELSGAATSFFRFESCRGFMSDDSSLLLAREGAASRELQGPLRGLPFSEPSGLRIGKRSL